MQITSLPMTPGRLRRAVALLAMLLVGCLSVLPAPGSAQPNGLVTRSSAHSVRETLDRFAAAVQAEGWVVFIELDHAAAARDAGLALRPRTVVLFGNPRAGTGAMASNPTLALDLPMRVLVWQDDAGAVRITRSTGADIATRVFARHGIDIPPAGQQATEDLIARLVDRAAQ